MTRGEDLARRFEAASDEFTKTVEGLADAEWNAPCHDEERCLNQVAYHVAAGHPFIFGLVEGIVAGRELPTPNPETGAQRNAQQASERANVTKSETLELHRKSTAEVARGLRGLSDADFDRKANFMGQSMRAQDFVENWLIGHMTGHLQSLRPPA